MSSFIGDLPADFICPITQELMEYPFITAVGNTYEYSAIARWLKSHNQDPLTKMELANKTLIPNNTLRASIQSWLDENPQFDDLRNRNVEKPPQEAYSAGNGKTSTGSPLERILRVDKSFTLGGKKKERLLQQQRLRTVISCGHTYSWDPEGKHVRCDDGPLVKAPHPDMFITPFGIVFYDSRDLCDSRILPGTDLADECKFGVACTKAGCVYAHPFVCPWGLGCRNLPTNKCKLMHPTSDSVVPLGTTFPLNQQCRYNCSCSNSICMYAHPQGRLTIQRQAARIFVTHSLTLETLSTPIEIPITWSNACTTYQIQGEFVFCFEPYPGTWAKQHFRSVTVQRFDPSTRSYRVVATYSLEKHYCNCAVAAGRYLVISFWPYEEEAIRIVWESLRISRTMEKALKSSTNEVESLKSEVAKLTAQLQQKENELSMLKAELARSKEDTEKLRSQKQQLESQLSQAKSDLKQRKQQISSLVAQAEYRDQQHERKVGYLQTQLSQSRNDANEAREKKREYQTMYQRSQQKIHHLEQNLSEVKAARDRERQFRAMQQRSERQRNERLRLRDPIHVYALRDGHSGFDREDWALVLDYHKGAHDLSLSSPDISGKQTLEVVENSTVVQFELCVPGDVAQIGAPLPLQPGRLCEEF